MSKVNQLIRRVRAEQRLNCVEIEGELQDCILISDFERIAREFEEKKKPWAKRSVSSLRHRAKAKTSEAVKVYPDGREVCQNNAAGDAEYKRRRRAMFDRQNGICALSGKPMEWCDYPLSQADCTFDHQEGRGVGGAKRDDRIEIDGKWYNAAVRWDENEKKGSKRIPYLPEVQIG